VTQIEAAGALVTAYLIGSVPFGLRPSLRGSRRPGCGEGVEQGDPGPPEELLEIGAVDDQLAVRDASVTVRVDGGEGFRQARRDEYRLVLLDRQVGVGHLVARH